MQQHVRGSFMYDSIISRLLEIDMCAATVLYCCGVVTAGFSSNVQQMMS